MRNPKRHFPNWWKNVQVGDVLKAPSGALRVVREVSGKVEWGPRKCWVVFVIMHCSWTGRCHTTYNLAELMCLGYRPTYAALPLRTKLDRMIAEEIRVSQEEPRTTRMLTCCDVLGIA